jgi:SSS family solute:Na+ symporter
VHPNPNISEILSPLDYIVFIAIILITLGFVFYGNRKKDVFKNESDQFLDLMLMGRRLTLPMFTATLVATWYGGIFGVAQIAFEHGIFNFVTQGVFWYITYFIFAFFIIKRISKYEAMTLPDLIGQMFGPKSGKLSAVFNVLNLIPIAYTISIGLLIQLVFNIPLQIGIIIGVLFVLSYSLIGGFRAVVFSDIFQFFIMIFSVLLVFILSYSTYGTGVLSSLPDTYFQPLSTFSLSETLVWGFIALGTLVDPNFYQRCFAATDFKTAKKGILVSTFIWILFDLSLTFGAIYAKAIIPEADSSNGYFYYALQLLPNGLKGFFLAGICATILSTLDSYIFLAGSTLAYDLVPKRLKGKVSIHHLGIVSVSILSVLLSYVFDGNIKNVWKTLGSISSSALLVPVVFGYIFPKRIQDNGFIFASILGAIGTMYWRLSGLKYDLNIDEIYFGMSCSSLGICLVLLVSRTKQRN